MYKTNNNYHTLEEYYSSNEIKQLQSATTWPEGCKICQLQETQNQVSVRQNSNGSLNNIIGVRYEIMPSNVCNLKCVMCVPAASTALAKELYTVGIEIQDLSRENSSAKQQLELLSKVNNIESISIIGGEFFLTKHNLEIMDFAIQAQAPLRIVTNATVILDSHLERLKKISNLELQISIDGYEQGYEIMRYPANWKVFAANVTRLIQALPQAKINFHFVAQVLNIQQLVPTLDWCNKQRRQTRITNLVYPEYLTWKVFSTQERNNIVELLKIQCTQYQITKKQQEFVKNLCNTILTVTHNSVARQQFESRIQRIYEHRWPDLKEQDPRHWIRQHVFYPLT